MTYITPTPPTPISPSPASFQLEAVIVCDGYPDFLAQTLPHNKQLFDKIVVVTSYEALQTRRICEHWHVQCVMTDDLQTRKGLFCKGKGINAGLNALGKAGWVAHIDADIFLPPQTRLLLQNAQLDPSMLYGIDRFLVRGHQEWLEFIEQPRLQHESETYIHLNAFPLGTRVMHHYAGGYVPIGFFQLWNPTVSGVTSYPEDHTDAGRGDTLFAQQWPRAKRSLLGELVGYHLESEDARNAANWCGRKTSYFGVSKARGNRHVD